MTEEPIARVIERVRALVDVEPRFPGSAAKRVNVTSSEWMGDDWFVGHGKDESCQIEGTRNHWEWLAMLTLGLADWRDSPYSEDKPLPFNPRETLLRLADEVERLERIAQFLYARLDDIDTASDIAKDRDGMYRRMVERVQKRRFEVATTDGYAVMWRDNFTGGGSHDHD